MLCVVLCLLQDAFDVIFDASSLCKDRISCLPDEKVVHDAGSALQPSHPCVNAPVALAPTHTALMPGSQVWVSKPQGGPFKFLFAAPKSSVTLSGSSVIVNRAGWPSPVASRHADADAHCPPPLRWLWPSGRKALPPRQVAQVPCYRLQWTSARLSSRAAHATPCGASPQGLGRRCVGTMAPPFMLRLLPMSGWVHRMLCRSPLRGLPAVQARLCG